MNIRDQLNHIDNIGTRFHQFIITVNGALIAYSLKQIEDQVLSFSIIPLTIAIILWSLGFYFGIKSIKRLISMRIVDAFNSKQINPEIKEIGNEKFKELGDLANKNDKRMFWFLYAGGIAYIVWQFIKMYLKTYY
ncbi:hypothetical protein [uncultured Aquimarina sp.]|uniref:hypothetical protein n=1 Tax=uncultured Aquimarina sp. TaxID=575652 RepID=UPI002637263D|nr:hypothetical protein [uncultured Aquimarina sp.]